MGRNADGKGATVMIIKSKGNNATNNTDQIFGGYTPIPWATHKTSYDYKASDGTGWIFSLRDDNKNKEKPWQFKYRITKNEVYHLAEGKGWISGFYDSFYIKEQCHTNKKSYSVMGAEKWNTLIKPDGFPVDAPKSYQFLAGTEYF